MRRILPRLLWRSSRRHLQRHPALVILCLIGIALGVGLVLAIDLALESSRRAFQLSLEAVTGRATHQIVGGVRGLPEDLYARLRVEAGIRSIAPVLEGHVTLTQDASTSFALLGIDPFADGDSRPWLRDSVANGQVFSNLVARRGGVLMDAVTADRLDLKAGDRVELLARGKRFEIEILALMRPSSRSEARLVERTLIADIATAQELLDMVGFLHRIDVRASGDEVGESLVQQIEERLPADAEVIVASARRDNRLQMTRAFDLNLTSLSLLALIVGLFLIYNTMTFSVLQRRNVFGRLRAHGVTRREIFTAILSEALVLGLIGTLLGVLLGYFLASGLISIVSSTISDLYFQVSVREVAIAPLLLVKALLLGLGATLLASLLPAREATRAAPRATLSRSDVETRATRRAPWLALTGGVMAILGVATLSVEQLGLAGGYAGLLLILVGFALSGPLATLLGMRVVGAVLGNRCGPVGRLAPRGVAAALSRTGVAISALAVAVATTLGVGITVESFRTTVEKWLEQTLRADVYLTVPSAVVRRSSEAVLSEELVGRLSATPGVSEVITNRAVTLRSGGRDTQLVALGLGRHKLAAFDFLRGDPEQLWETFEQGAVLISEPLAHRRKLDRGDVLSLRTASGDRDFTVAGIFYDYASDQGYACVSQSTYERFWEDRGYTSLGFMTEDGVAPRDLVSRLRARAGDEQELVIRSNLDLRQISLDIFDRTFKITSVLRLLAAAVAFIGVLSALMSLQVERYREFAMLRAHGLTPRQLGSLVTGQTGLMGLVAGLLAAPLGVVFAAVLGLVINKRSFGWSLQLELGPHMFLEGIALALVAALIAGLYPAWRIARVPPAPFLRVE